MRRHLIIINIAIAHMVIVISCRNKTGKKWSTVKKGFFRVLRVIVNQGEHTEELISEQRRMWISAIRRDD